MEQVLVNQSEVLAWCLFSFMLGIVWRGFFKWMQEGIEK